MTTERFLPATGIHNFRDYGGYRTREGARVRRGELFRSGHHYDASDEDLALVSSLGLAHVIDLRGKSERESHPCRRPPGFSARVICHPGETTSAPPHEMAAGEGLSGKDARQRMIAVYTRMPANPAMAEMFGRFLRALAEDEGPSLVHCFAGKDRTGIAASLLLHILGVEREDLIEEFLLTNKAPTLAVLRAQAIPRLEARYGRIEEEAVDNLLKVHPEYFGTWVATTEDLYGSIDGYLETAVGVDKPLREALCARFLA